jgi:hypothetical protein
MTPQSSPVARAIAELETERANLATRLDKVDVAIASLRELFHLPAAVARPRGSNGNGHPHDPDVDARIRAALKTGPLSPGALGAAVGLERAELRVRIRELEHAGVLACSGATASRRIALAGAPAKEAP